MHFHIEEIEKENKLCNVGDELYNIRKEGIQKVVVTGIEKAGLGFYIYNTEDKPAGENKWFVNENFGENLFKTEEECKYAIWRINTIKEKRRLLKEYEKK